MSPPDALEHEPNVVNVQAPLVFRIHTDAAPEQEPAGQHGAGERRIRYPDEDLVDYRAPLRAAWPIQRRTSGAAQPVSV
jgi:hypothetical protein